MNRIFLTLASLSTLLLVAAFVLGMNIDDPASATDASLASVRVHFLAAVGGLMFAALVHAIVLTYFMGTGRWIEETGHVYPLPARIHQESRGLKYRILPAMAGCLTLLIVTGALGAIADPATRLGGQGWWGIPASTLHFSAAAFTLCVNVIVNYYQYAAIEYNGRLIEEVLQEVRRVRLEKGLPV